MTRRVTPQTLVGPDGDCVAAIASRLGVDVAETIRGMELLVAQGVAGWAKGEDRLIPAPERVPGPGTTISTPAHYASGLVSAPLAELSGADFSGRLREDVVRWLEAGSLRWSEDGADVLLLTVPMSDDGLVLH